MKKTLVSVFLLTYFSLLGLKASEPSKKALIEQQFVSLSENGETKTLEIQGGHLAVSKTSIVLNVSIEDAAHLGLESAELSLPLVSTPDHRSFVARGNEKGLGFDEIYVEDNRRNITDHGVPGPTEIVFKRVNGFGLAEKQIHIVARELSLEIACTNTREPKVGEMFQAYRIVVDEQIPIEDDSELPEGITTNRPASTYIYSYQGFVDEVGEGGEPVFSNELESMLIGQVKATFKQETMTVFKDNGSDKKTLSSYRFGSLDDSLLFIIDTFDGETGDGIFHYEFRRFGALFGKSQGLLHCQFL